MFDGPSFSSEKPEVKSGAILRCAGLCRADTIREARGFEETVVDWIHDCEGPCNADLTVFEQGRTDNAD